MVIEEEYKILDIVWIIEGKEKSKRPDLEVVKGVIIEIKNVDNNKSLELITEESLKRSSFARSRKMHNEDLSKNDISTVFFLEKEAIQCLTDYEQEVFDTYEEYHNKKINKLRQMINKPLTLIAS